MFNSILRGLLGTEESPTKVIEVKSDNYLSRPILYREDSILLYGPKPGADKRNPREKCYEILLHRPFTESLHQVYSLFRTENQPGAEERFISFKDKIPVFLIVTKECSLSSLQRICDIISEHPGWTVAHMVAHFGLYDLFNNAEVQKHLNDIDTATGMTPIMVAITTSNLRMVQSLVSLKCSMTQSDFEGNTVFHYAGASNKEIINILSSSSTECLNKPNQSGQTPLHAACLADKPDCVRALLLAGADVNVVASRSSPNAARSTSFSGPGYVADVLQDTVSKLYTQDMKFGGTPLHWAQSREVIEALVVKNCHVNALNFDGRTAIHIMVLRDRLECTVALLSRNAEPSIPDKVGNTPLHLAAKHTNIAIVQALVIFGADLNYANNAGETPRHCVPVDMSSSNYDKILFVLHSVGARRCRAEMAGCGPGCVSGGSYDGCPPPPVAGPSLREDLNQMLATAAMERASCLNQTENKGRLLCLDGGGIRGLVLIQMLRELEEMLGKPLVHCFDWIAGTSTGGILALALAIGKSLKECQCLYFRMKENAFVGSRPYPSENLESILKECLGTETVMSDITHPKLMIMGVLADRKPVDLHIFRNYRSAQEILNAHNGTDTPPAEAGVANTVAPLPAPPPPHEQLLWQAARASGAAPSYFRAFGRYLDGGLIANNPTLDALTELAELRLALRATGCQQEAEATQLRTVVSCGTGRVPVTKLKDIDVFRPENIWDTARLAFGISAIGTLLVDQATMADGRVVERARAWCAGVGVALHRFSPQLSRDVAMDERADDKLVTMLWEAKAYMYQNRDRVREVCTLIDV